MLMASRAMEKVRRTLVEDEKNKVGGPFGKEQREGTDMKLKSI